MGMVNFYKKIIFSVLLTGIITAGMLGRASFKNMSKLGLKPSVHHSWKEWRIVRDSAIPIITASSIVNVSLWMAQVALVQQSDGHRWMGAYQAANQWRSMVFFLPSKVLNAYLPILSSLRTSQSKSVENVQNRMFLYMIVGTITLGLPFIITAPWIMELYGKEFVDYWPILSIIVIIPAIEIGHMGHIGHINPS